MSISAEVPWQGGRDREPFVSHGAVSFPDPLQGLVSRAFAFDLRFKLTKTFFSFLDLELRKIEYCWQSLHQSNCYYMVSVSSCGAVMEHKGDASSAEIRTSGNH